MKISQRKTKQFLLFLLDMLAFIIAIYVALLVRKLNWPTMQDWLYHVKMFIPIICYGIPFMYLFGLYVISKPTGNREILKKLSIIGIAGWAIGFVFFYFQRDNIHFPKTILLYYWICFCFLAWINRVILTYILKRKSIPVVFLGNTKSLDTLLNDLRTNSMLGYKPIFAYRSKEDEKGLFNVWIDKIGYKEFLYVYSDNEPVLNGISSYIHSLFEKGAQFIEYSTFYEYVERKIPQEDIGESWFLSNIFLWKRRPYFFVKRLFDILLSSIGLILTVWFWPIIALLIHIDSAGPVFFVQEREGLRGKKFNLLKFRSMYVHDSDSNSADKTSCITQVGKIFRATRLDELPQFINVIKGDMSLIGPRPEQPKLAAKLEKEVPWYRQRLLVRPGITGWDQVCGEYHSASKEDTFKKLQSDLYYIKNISLFLDISIIFKTIGTVFRREGK